MAEQKFLDNITGLPALWEQTEALVSGKQDKLTFDATPTADSANPVTSGGIKEALDKIQNGGSEYSIWTGTKAEYDAIESKDSKTIYFCTG